MKEKINNYWGLWHTTNDRRTCGTITDMWAMGPHVSDPMSEGSVSEVPIPPMTMKWRSVGGGEY
jgi:hypothetical protein